ncbi:hypothetical protein [Streptomyces sp. HGB0020]|jgi:hypothetical protein|uniref:hypothetical protein n=1 Tax=Streptomyces sp. HGB0020 TaxID=1078086 RepID=UPI00034E7243|nr:hypothetical protein [Streptomyces sp. HGB0020]EPD56376.1 hypothetical protein HMPREF1211_07496 [Streptomyces sp. HGB0020]
MPGRIVTCRVLNRLGDQCTGEAVDPGAELKICVRHLAEAQRLIHEAFRRTRAKDAKTADS